MSAPKKERLEKDLNIHHIRDIQLEPINPHAGNINLKMVETLGMKGFTLAQVGSYLGYAEKYFVQSLCRDNPQIKEALEKGRMKRVERISDALVDAAIEDKNVTAMIFWLKAQAGWSDKAEIKLEVNQDKGLKDMSETELLNLAKQLEKNTKE